jgi:hypothetical protein
MDPRQVSAKFAAYAWYSGLKDTTATTEEQAVQFASEHWSAFLPHAHEGLGRLLLRVAAGKQRSRSRDQRRLTVAAE